MRNLIVAATSVLAVVAACAPAQRGFTECNGVQCQPGQYCFGGGICANGCLSSVNCAEGQECRDDGGGDNAGVCADPDGPAGGEGEGEGEGDDPATCDGYATHAQSCGLRASEAEAIRQQCDQLTADQQSALIACNASESCSEFESCSGVQCFVDADCGAGQHCLQRSEVVDPLSDVPYTCR